MTRLLALALTFTLGLVAQLPMPYQPNYDACAGIYYTQVTNILNGPCWGNTGTVASCSQTAGWIAYLKDKNGHTLQQSKEQDVTAYGKAGYYITNNGTAHWPYQTCAPLWSVGGGTKPNDSTRWQWVANGYDREPGSTGVCAAMGDYGYYHSAEWDIAKPICGPIGCPLIVDPDGQGFHLTNLQEGVRFREHTQDAPIQFSWTDPLYHNAWLALPDERGEVRSLEQLFGNFTPQPPSDRPNGFAALAQYDANHDGVINSLDPVYTKLRLWIDSNHDGIAQAGELHTLQELQVESISLNYRESRRTDQYGNDFRYVAPADIGNVGRQDDRVYDVFLVTEPNTP